MIRNQEAFSPKVNWYKGNLHSHTVNSDGRLTPEQAVRLYREHGYHFLCFSEHDLYTDYRKKFDCEEFIILPGLEASAVLYEEKPAARGVPPRPLKTHHIHGILGTDKMQRQAKGRTLCHRESVPPLKYYGSWNGAAVAQELADYLRMRGCVTTYNHPVWSRVEAEEFIHTEGLWALEVFNYNTVNESNTGFDTISWDTMLRKGKRILAVAADDNHNGGVFDDACGGYIVVKASELPHEAILHSMITGNYYSSAGPKIHSFGVRDGMTYVECSPVSRIDFIAGNHINDGASFLAQNNKEGLSRAEYRLHGDETYVRVQCTDRDGNTAWSNPLYAD